MEGEVCSLGGECNNKFVEGKMDSNLHRRWAPPPCTPQPETLICWCGWGLPLTLRLQRSDPGRGLGLAAQKQPKEAGLRQLRVCSEEAWAYLRGMHHYWGGARGEGQDHHKSFFLCECSQATGHCLHELWGQAQVAAPNGGFRVRHRPCPHHPGSAQGPLYLHTSYQGDNSQHTLRKEQTSKLKATPQFWKRQRSRRT